MSRQNWRSISSLHTIKISFKSKNHILCSQKYFAGGVIMTMTKVLSRYLIPTLRKLFKFIIRKCLACKKYQATSYPVPNPGPLRKARTEQCFTFQGRGVNYAGHIFYCSTTRKDLKAYILLFSSSVSRAL